MALSLDGSLQYTFPLGPTVRSRRLSKKKGYLWGGPLYGADSCHRRRVNELSREPKIAEAHPERVGQQQVLRVGEDGGDAEAREAREDAAEGHRAERDDEPRASSADPTHAVTTIVQSALARKA